MSDRPPRRRASDLAEVAGLSARGRGASVFVARNEGARPCPGGRPATHEHVVLVFYTGGSATVEQRGLWQLHAGDAFLIPAGEPHRFRALERPEAWALGLCPVCLLADGGGALLEPFERVRSGAAAAVTIPEGRRPFLESLFRELKRETDEVASGGLAVQKSLATLIVAEIARAGAWGQPAGPADLVSDALRFIERRCLEPISLRDVAAALRRSPAHLTTAVRRATGRSVQAWIIAGRLSEARRRLAHTDEIVEVVAERVGYADVTHFTRVFRRAHGLTPAAWRARERRALSTAAR
ncbi:MAG TPA: AraC family transcriptional regulator [Polyangiaceae bacterium]|nr:AraC family transcriptional regulator [Polyangiaceae bacterium]